MAIPYHSIGRMLKDRRRLCIFLPLLSILFGSCTKVEPSSSEGETVMMWACGSATREITIHIVDSQASEPIAGATLVAYHYFDSLKIDKIKRLRREGHADLPDTPSGSKSSTDVAGVSTVELNFSFCEATLYSGETRVAYYPEGQLDVVAAGYTPISLKAKEVFAGANFSELPTSGTITLQRLANIREAKTDQAL